MSRLFILLALSLPLAATPALACGMESQAPSASLAELLDEVDAATDEAVEQASSVVEGATRSAEGLLARVPEADLSDLSRLLPSEAERRTENAVAREAAVYAVEGTFEEVVVDQAMRRESEKALAER